MKANILFVSIIIASLIAVSAEAAQQKPTLQIHKAAVPIKIDGDLKEYAGLKPAVTMDNASFEKLAYNPWDGKTDLSADIYLLWDEENLYVAARVIDDVPFVNSQEGPDIWNGDCIELTLGMDEKADPERPVYGKGDYQIGLSPGNNKGIKPSDWIWNRYDYTGGIEVASKPVHGFAVDGGYTIEARIPFKILGGFKPAVGKKIDFDVIVDDADKDKRQIQFVWAGTKNFYMSPYEWGVAVFAAPQSVFILSSAGLITAIAVILICAIFINFVIRRLR